MYRLAFYQKHHQNVGKHTIHGSFGWELDKFHMMICSWITWVRNFPKIRTVASWPKTVDSFNVGYLTKSIHPLIPFSTSINQRLSLCFFPDFFRANSTLFKSKDKTQETQRDCFASMDVTNNDVAIVCQDFDRLAKNLISSWLECAFH